MLFIAFAGFRGSRARETACRKCGARIASEDDFLSVAGRPVRAAYVNPAGIRCQILTLAKATNVAAALESTEEHTWFEGYAWSPAACASCGLHLGWRYEAAGPDLQPPSFYGLLAEALSRPGDPGRDM